MEWLSRKAQASIFFYGGPLMLPIPHRVNITLGVGNMVKVEKVSIYIYIYVYTEISIKISII